MILPTNGRNVIRTPSKKSPTSLHRETRPLASPPINFSTLLILTKLASPLMVCFKQEAATEKFKACWSSAKVSTHFHSTQNSLYLNSELNLLQ